MLETIVSRRVDQVFGDEVILFPRRRGEVSSISDPDRAQVTAVGIVDFNPRVVSPKGKEQHDAFQPNLVGEKVHVSFEDGAFGARTLWPRQADRLRAHTKSGVHHLEVVTTEPDELGRIVCACKLLPNGSEL